MKIKKIFALALACTILASTTVTASASGTIDWDSTWSTIWEDINWDVIYEEYPDTDPEDFGLRYDPSTGNIALIEWENGSFKQILEEEFIPKGHFHLYELHENEDKKVYDRESEAIALAIKATGIPYEAWATAAKDGKSIAEYFSNTVMTVPGLDEATPVGQGGNVVIDGKNTGATISIQKPLLAHVDSAKSMASTIGGRVLNVVGVETSAVFEKATVNFYLPGVTAQQNIQIYQYVAGEWVSVNVVEVRADHVVADLTSLGILAFVEVQ